MRHLRKEARDCRDRGAGEACEQAHLGHLLKNSMLKRRFAEKTFENFLLHGAHRERQEKKTTVVIEETGPERRR